MPEILSEQEGPILLAQVANQNAVFVSSCPLVTQLYINNSNNIYYELSSKGKVYFCLCFFYLCILIGSTDQWPLVHFLFTVFQCKITLFLSYVQWYIYIYISIIYLHLHCDGGD